MKKKDKKRIGEKKKLTREGKEKDKKERKEKDNK